jgi:hypothetical protein
VLIKAPFSTFVKGESKRKFGKNSFFRRSCFCKKTIKSFTKKYIIEVFHRLSLFLLFLERFMKIVQAKGK